MASKTLFKGARSFVPAANTVNAAGGAAFAMSDKHALAQLAATGCLGSTFYANAEAQLDQVLGLAMKLPPEFVAKVAVYARKKGRMKDMPALLAAVLAARKETVLLERIFPRVIDNGKMLRNFCQIVRSGQTGRKSFGTAPKRLIRKWFENRDAATIFKQSVGNDPSFGDIVKMVHPKAEGEKDALFSWLIGKKGKEEGLPQIVKEFLAFVNEDGPVPANLPFQMVSSLQGMSERQWGKLAATASWTSIRMNINTFMRHGVFNNKMLVHDLATTLKNPAEIKRSGCFPYQLLTTYKNISPETPREIVDALHDALEVATENVPAFEGRVIVAPDVSGSMNHAVTGDRGSVTSATRCTDVAALITAVILRKNPSAVVLPFDTGIRRVDLEPRDSVMTNAKKLAMGGGGTNCSVPVAHAADNRLPCDLFVMVSDNESWAGFSHKSTPMQEAWQRLKRINPKAKMVCIDLTPNTSTQVLESNDVLNIGGFSDSVFEIIAEFAKGGGKDKWVQEIESTEL